MYKKILLPIDGSKYAETAAKHAIEIACLNGAEILALNVIETYSLAPMIRTSLLAGSPEEDLLTEDDLTRIREIWRIEGKKALENISNSLKEIKNKNECIEVKLTCEIKEGHPADVILNTIENENIDLVVIGTSGRHGLDRFLLGSVAEKIVKSAKCPVLVVHDIK